MRSPLENRTNANVLSENLQKRGKKEKKISATYAVKSMIHHYSSRCSTKFRARKKRVTHCSGSLLACNLVGKQVDRWETSRRKQECLKSPVARILLANYEVIGKLSRWGTRLAALYLITSNKRYSPPPLFFLPLALLSRLSSFPLPFLFTSLVHSPYLSFSCFVSVSRFCCTFSLSFAPRR